MYVENANRSSQTGAITPENMEPNPKNPIIASFFRNIGYADQLGSGVRNLFKYSKHYSGKEPEFVEGDVFRIIVPLDDGCLDNGSQGGIQDDMKIVQATQSAAQATRLMSLRVQQDIIALIVQEPELSQKQIAERLKLNVNTVKYYIRKMQEHGRIEHIGSARGGGNGLSGRMVMRNG